jgi:ABC-type transport system involved in multi-copper enzyme maturation permease subunit
VAEFTDSLTMIAGPILTRELLTASRRTQTYRERCVLAALMLVVFCGFYVTSSHWNAGRLSVHELAAVAESAFGWVVLVQFLLTGWLVPVFVAGVIAGERERGTLDDVLTTRLSSAEIILGKLAAGLLLYFTCLATGFPIVALLPLLGGVDPRMILLAYAGTISTAVFLTGLSVIVSIHAPRGGQALRQTIGLEVVWLGLPVAALLVPRTWPGLWPWIRPVNDWLTASTPMWVWLGPATAGSGTTLFEAFFWMIGLQLAIGSTLIACAIARLRGASRARGASGILPALARWWRVRRPRLIPRPSCGSAPVLWKELYTARPIGFARLVGVAVFLVTFPIIAYGCFDLGKPAAVEWFEHAAAAASDVNRIRFNNFLRLVTSLVELSLLIFIAAAAAESVAAERTRRTWDSLLTTELEGREILRDKMRGARRTGRWGILLLVGLWAAGLVTGSVHPLGALAALAVLLVSTWFGAALGVYVSLLARDVTRAARGASGTVLALSCTALVCLVPSRITSVLLGAGSMPWVNWLCLVSYRDLSEAVRLGTFNALTSAGIYTDEGPLNVLATCLVGVIGYAVAAAWLNLTAQGAFEQIAGRARRAGAPDTLDPPSRWARRIMRSALVGAAGLAVVAAGSVARHWERERALRTIVSELDRRSPGWRLEDLDQARAPVPDWRNGALLVLEAGASLPPDWPGSGGEPALDKRLRAVLASAARGEPAKVEDLLAVRAARDAAGTAVVEARALADLPDGRYRLKWSRDGISTPLPHFEVVKKMAAGLACDAALRAIDGDADGTIVSCRALLNTGRSLGDEPLLVSQMARMVIDENTCRQVEYALAHGRPSDHSLELLQRLLDDEQAQPLAWWGFLGERGLFDRFLEHIDSGELTPMQIRNIGLDFGESSLFAASATRSRTAILRYYSQAIELSKLPAPEQHDALARLQETARGMPFAARMFAPAVKNIMATDHRRRARLLCSSSALAAERYRLAHGHWPPLLEALVPRFLGQVPADPFDGKPLRLHRRFDGITVSAVGPDRRDDQGMSAAQLKWTASDDVVFHLRDIERRHRPEEPRK